MSLRFYLILANLLLAALLTTPAARAQTRTWGVNGFGGSGTWDLQTANWYTGFQNVTWPEGGNAIFGGASGGTVTVSGFFSSAPIVSSMTFNTPGYVIEGGYIRTGASGLTVTTNVDATINSRLADSTDSGSFLVKDGPAALQVDDFGFLDEVRVNQGDLRLTESASLFFSDVVLADAAGATVTLAESTAMASLSGGGLSGGVVRPIDQPGTVPLTIFGDGVFGGTLADNGSGVLRPTLFGDMTFTNANTHSGPTSILDPVTFTGNGSALNSAMSISSDTLTLDNGDTVVPNRVSDTLPFELSWGGIRLEGNSTTPVEELVGPLEITGGSTITVNQPGSAETQLTFAGFGRNDYATLTVAGPGVHIAGMTNDATGILPPYVTAGTEWATVDGESHIVAFDGYNSDINSAATSDHVKLAPGGTTTLAADATRASLNMQNAGAGEQTLDLAGRNLELTTGGVLSSGGPNSIRGGSLSTTAQEMLVTANNDLTIDSVIADGSGPTALNKAGPGTLTLNGANSYSGPTVITEGTLIVASDENLGTGPMIDLNRGTLRAAASFSSTKGFARSTNHLGSVDTAGFDLVFSGPNVGGLAKTGPGRLTITGESTGGSSVSAGVLELRGDSTGDHTVWGGTLEIANALSGRLALNGGTVQVAGTVESFNVTPFHGSGGSVLDIGGPSAATLTTGRVFTQFTFGDSLQVNFGIGSAAADFWHISNGFILPSSFGEAAFEFAFHNLGGVTTDVDYPLMALRSLSFRAEESWFAFAPESIDAGWSGEFSIDGEIVSVRFLTVPEPSVTALLLLQGAALALWAGRRRRRVTV